MESREGARPVAAGAAFYLFVFVLIKMPMNLLRSLREHGGWCGSRQGLLRLQLRLLDW